MATIKTVCPRCGEITLTAADVALHVPAHEAASYAFTCPDCGREVRKPADRRVVALLRSGGVAEHARVARPERLPAGGAPLDVDDLLDLHELLARDDWFDHLLAVDARPAT